MNELILFFAKIGIALPMVIGVYYITKHIKD